MERVTPYSIFYDEYKDHVASYIIKKSNVSILHIQDEIDYEISRRWYLIPKQVKDTYIKKTDELNKLNSKNTILSNLKKIYKREYSGQELDNAIIEEYKNELINGSKNKIEVEAIDKLVKRLECILCNNVEGKNKVSKNLTSFVEKIRLEFITKIRDDMINRGVEKIVRNQIKYTMRLRIKDNIIKEIEDSEEFKNIYKEVLESRRSCLEKTLEKNIINKIICIICMTDERNILFIKCKHMVCCKTCAYKCSRCPVCREEIKEYIDVYT
jgi:hypothetical protein